jgi:hypothetical protein
MPSAPTPAFDLRERRRPVAGRQMLFLAVEHHLHGRARLLRELGADDALDVRAELAAEPAAHVLGDDADIRLRNPERLGEAFARAVHGLRRCPRRQVVALPLADAAVRLEADVRQHLRLVAGLDDVRGRLEAGVEIAALLRLAFRDVAVLEDLRRAVLQRLGDVRDVRQHLVLHLDQAQRVACLLFRRRGDRGDSSPWYITSLPGSMTFIAAFTPGAFCAAVRSIDTTRACGCGERRMRPCSWPGRLMS